MKNENNNNNELIISSHKEDENNNNYLNLKNNLINNQNEEFSNINENNLNSNKNILNNIQIKPVLNKVKTFNKERRFDKFGNKIIHGGKQKVSFIDKISKNNFTEVIKVENYKQYNKMEEISNNKGNNCCSLL